jgi:GTPase
MEPIPPTIQTVDHSQGPQPTSETKTNLVLVETQHIPISEKTPDINSETPNPTDTKMLESKKQKPKATHKVQAPAKIPDQVQFSIPEASLEKKLEDYSVRVTVVGNVDSGKSTLVGVLTKGMYDDGRGSARLRVFNYPHEVTNGRTSSVAQEIMGFDAKGQQIFPDRFVQNKNKYWQEVVSKSTKVQSLVDLCGHEKYLKTTMFGMVGLYPDYSMVIVGANMGLSRMTKEHIGITLALKIPFFVVVTKIDMTPPEITEATMQQLKKILHSKNAVNKEPYIFEDLSDIEPCVEGIYEDVYCPVFKVSNTTGQGLDM